MNVRQRKIPINVTYLFSMTLDLFGHNSFLFDVYAADYIIGLGITVGNCMIIFMISINWINNIKLRGIV